MRQAATTEELRREIATLPRPLVLVPTMGALHEGHLTLVRRAREAAGPGGTVAVSIFVNPIQFDRPGDLAAYPQPLADDLAKCEAEGVDLVFTPAAGGMYFPDRSITVTESLLSRHLCGATRPGHFDGVATVVAKLLNAVRPEVALFGEKDFQQLAVIRRMATDLGIRTEIVGVPTVRDRDGLALSSRNALLSDEDRHSAIALPNALNSIRQAIAAGRPVAEALRKAKQALVDAGFLKIDYLALVDAATLEPLETPQGEMRLLAAATIGTTRLIDNIAVP